MKYYFNEIGSYFGSIMRDELEDEYMSVSKFYVDTFNLNQWHIYGSSRLGVYNADLNLVNVYFHADTTGGDFDSVNVEHTYVASPNYNLFNLVRGAKRYELSNWLGNVNAVVTDKKIPVCYADTVHHYTADVISAQDYSPFGAPLPDRSYDLIRDQSHNIIHTDSFNSTTEDWVVASGTASLAQALGKMRVTINSSGASAREYFPTVRYNKYVYSVRIDTGNIAGIIVSVKDSASGTTLATQTVTVSGNYSLSFTAAGPSTYLYVTQTGTYSAGKIFFVDNVVVEEDLAFKSAYSFHFNGKENDNETQTQDYGFRIYDYRLSRFLSVDPLTKEYPELTPYQFASNRPIDGIDRDGLEYATFTIFIKEGKVMNISVKKDYELKDKNSLGPGIQYNYAYLGKDGKMEKFEAKPLVKNLYGIYQGKDNPKLPKIGGDPGIKEDDYRLSPIDETDALAEQHDKDYDKSKVSGFNGVMSKESTTANRAYIKGATNIIEKEKNGGIDNITGKPVTKETSDAAKFGKRGFVAAEAVKTTDPSNGKQ